MIFLTILMEILVFTLALSIDSFAASFAYGAGKIKIPFSSVLTMSGLCSIILFLSLLIGHSVTSVIPSETANGISFFLLSTIGFIKLFDSRIRHLINEGGLKQRKIHFQFCSISFIITIYGDPEKANIDQGQDLSPKEAISLALALSLDSGIAGLSAGTPALHPFLTLFCSLIFGIFAVILGSSLGNRLTEKSNLDFTWLGGVLLICLAFFEYFFAP